MAAALTCVGTDTPIIQAQAASIIHLRVKLLASQESEKRLAEALELVLNRGTSGRGTALRVLRAYREAGREKP